jgi:DNA-binding transcriptional LysR family regulator
LEEEIGVDLLKRSPRGVILTAEGKLFLEEVRELLKRADESVEKVRALARGEYVQLADIPQKHCRAKKGVLGASQ